MKVDARRIWWIGVFLLIFCSGCFKRVVPPQEKAISEPLVTGPEKVEAVTEAKTIPGENILWVEPPRIPSTPVESPVSRVNLGFEDLEKMTIEHEIKPGETLSEIAQQYDTAMGLLVRLNHVADPNKIRVGKKIKVLQGPFRMLIHKKKKTLSVFLKDLHIKTYDVAVGKSDSTPEGTFSIVDKMVEPVWTDPYTRLQIKAGDPRYPLGTRWLQFAEYGYGIHGTNDPSSIKTEASFGCIRMLNADVEEVYDMVSIGSEVVVEL